MVLPYFSLRSSKRSNVILLHSIDPGQGSPPPVSDPSTDSPTSSSYELFYSASAIIIMCNLFVLIVLCFKSVNNPIKRLYLINLSIADLLLGITVLVRALLLHDIVTNSNGYLVVCYFRLIVIVVSYGVSMSLLTALTLIIYIKVSRPLRVPFWITLISRHRCIIIGVWLTTLLLSTSICISQLQSVHHVDNVECLFISFYTPAVNLALFGVFFLVPTCVVVVCQSHILLIARRHVRRISVTSLTFHERVSISRQFKNAVTVAVMSAAFIVCWTPLLVLIVISEATGIETAIEAEGVRKDWITLVWYLNSLLNPIIYSWRLPEFRDNAKTLCKLIPFCSPCKKLLNWFSKMSRGSVRVQPNDFITYLETFKRTTSMVEQTRHPAEQWAMETQGSVLNTDMGGSNCVGETHFTHTTHL